MFLRYQVKDLSLIIDSVFNSTQIIYFEKINDILSKHIIKVHFRNPICDLVEFKNFKMSISQNYIIST